MNYSKVYLIIAVVCGALVSVMDTSCAARGARERLQKKLAAKDKAARAAVDAMATKRDEIVMCR